MEGHTDLILDELAVKNTSDILNDLGNIKNSATKNTATLLSSMLDQFRQTEKSISDTRCNIVDAVMGSTSTLLSAMTSSERNIHNNVVEARADIKNQLHLNLLDNKNDFKDIESTLCDFRKDSMKEFYENRLKSVEEAARLSREILQSEINTNSKFCALEDKISSQISDCCCSIKEQAAQIQKDAVQDELNELRLERAVKTYSYGNQFIGGNYGANYGVGNSTK